MMKHFWVIAMAVLLAGPVGNEVLAAGKQASKSSASVQMYRYRNQAGQLVIESSIPPEFVSKGYQILDGAGRVLQDVPPAISEEEKMKNRQQQEESAVLMKKDSELKKLYSSAQDAERLRDRQIESLLIKMDFVKGQLQQVNTKRRAEVEQAAKLERKGQSVPASMKESIDRHNRQILDLESQGKALEAERERIRLDFEPVIQRLKVIYQDKTTMPAPAAAVPAAARP